MDSVALATLIATVIAIYEAVLVALVARAGGARDTLMMHVRSVRRLLTEQPLQTASSMLEGKSWEEYAATTAEQREDLELRLKELLHPGLVAMRMREDAEEAEQLERREKERRALVRLADFVERDGEQTVKARLMAAGWDSEVIDRYLDRAKRAKSATPDMSSSWLQLHPGKSKHDLPLGQGDRGVVLLEVLAALACQPPMPRRIRESARGIVSGSDAEVPALASPAAAKAWAAQVQDKLRPAISLMAGRDAEIETLINAAEAQGYARLSDKTTQADGPSFLVELEEAQKSGRALSVSTVSALRDTYVTAVGLEISRDEWEATRPSRRYRWTLAAGLAIGAVVFVIGVVVPLLIGGAPSWLTVDVPAYTFGVVAISLVIFAFFYVLRL
jgi:hypothetical protein